MAKKMAKKTSPAKVAPVVPVDDMTTEDTLPMKMEYTDEELQDLIAEGQRQYEEMTGIEGSSLVPRFVIGRELANALLTRNAQNRFPDAKTIGKYAKLWTTNKIDENGSPIKGTMRWERSLPISVDISNEGNLHNSQKCLRAMIKTLDDLELNRQEVLNKKVVTDISAETGITEDDIVLTGILRDGFDNEAADKIDTAQQRSNTDLGYRRRLFDDYDFSFTRSKPTEGSTAEQLEKLETSWQERLPKLKNRLGKYLATALNYVSRRMWGRGKGPRETPDYGKEFHADLFVEALKTFPDATDSVFSVYKMMSESKTIFGGNIKKLASVEYFMSAHYLASMSDATYDKKRKVWVRADDGLAWADAWIEQLVVKNDYPNFVAWRKQVMAMVDRSDKDLSGIWHSLVYAWREFAFGQDDPSEAMPQLQLLLAMTTPYANYSKTSGPEAFDKIHHAQPTQADIDAMNTAKKGKGKPIATTAVAAPPVGAARPKFAARHK